jgi:hypothetical protein
VAVVVWVQGGCSGVAVVVWVQGCGAMWLKAAERKIGYVLVTTYCAVCKCCWGLLYFCCTSRARQQDARSTDDGAGENLLPLCFSPAVLWGGGEGFLCGFWGVALKWPKAAGCKIDYVLVRIRSNIMLGLLLSMAVCLTRPQRSRASRNQHATGMGSHSSS